MLSLFIVESKRFYIVKGDAESGLSSKMGEGLGFVLSYTTIDLVGGYKVVLPHYYHFDQQVPEVNGANEKDNFQKIMKHFDGFRYVESQADPNKLLSEGGNCQASALYLYESLRKNGFGAGLVLEPGHMHNWVVLDGKRYSVDLVRGKVEQM